MKHITVGEFIKKLQEFDEHNKVVFVDDKYSGDYDKDNICSVLDYVIGSDIHIYNAVETIHDHVVPVEDLDNEEVKSLHLLDDTKDNERVVAVSINGFYTEDI